MVWMLAFPRTNPSFQHAKRHLRSQLQSLSMQTTNNLPPQRLQKENLANHAIESTPSPAQIS